MFPSFWRILFWAVAAISIPPFLFMYGAWIALRLKKLGLARWRRWQVIWLRLGISLLAVGLLLRLAAPPAGRPAAYASLMGGLTNTLVAFFQGRVVDLLTRR